MTHVKRKSNSRKAASASSASANRRALMPHFSFGFMPSFAPNFDRLLMLAVLALALTGFLMVVSSSYVFASETLGDRYFYMKRHIIYLVIAFIAFTCAYHVKIEGLRKIAWPLFSLSLLLLVMVLVSSYSVYAGGAHRWLRIGGINFQPSEFAKLSMIVVLAHYATKENRDITHFVRGLLVPFLLIGTICMLILSEPDFGSAVSIFLVSMALLYVAGARFKHLVMTVLPLLPVAAYLVLGSSYRRQRLFAFLDPWKDPMDSGFQIIQSFVAIRSGGLFGKGIGDGVQKIFYLPEAHTDFVFATLGEELGFIGIVGVVFCFLVIVIRGARIAMTANDRFQSVMAMSIVFAIGLQAATNMAVVTGLLPTKGLTLPFLSFGGSSLVTMFLSVGLLQNIAANRGVQQRAGGRA